MSAKLLVPSGGLVQASEGEMFSPTQFGLDLLAACLMGSAPPSLKLEDDSVNAPAALALLIPETAAIAKAAARRVIERVSRNDMRCLLFVFMHFTSHFPANPAHPIVRTPSTPHP